MKSLRSSLIISSIVIVFLFSGVVSALNTDEASLSAVWLNQTIRPNDKVPVVVTFSSNSTNVLQVTRIAFHFDWMGENEFFIKDLSAPVTIASNDPHVFADMVIQIPVFVTPGSHTYFVSVAGLEGAEATEFIWDSPDFTLEITALPSGTTNPTPTNSPGSGGQADGSNLLLYVAVIAVVAVVVILVVVMMMRKRRKQPAPITGQPQPLENIEQ